MMASELELEVDQDHAALVEEAAQYVVHLKRHRVDRVEFRLGRPSEQHRVLGIDQRIIERVGFVVVFDDRMLELFAFFAAQPLGHRARHDIAHHGLGRDYLQAPAEHLAIVEAAHEVSRDAVALEQREEQLRHAVVHHTLVLDRAALLGVERGRVVLEVGDYEVGVGGRVELFRLALVKHVEHLRGVFHQRFSVNGISQRH